MVSTITVGLIVVCIIFVIGTVVFLLVTRKKKPITDYMQQQQQPQQLPQQLQQQMQGQMQQPQQLPPIQQQPQMQGQIQQPQQLPPIQQQPQIQEQIQQPQQQMFTPQMPMQQSTPMETQQAYNNFEDKSYAISITISNPEAVISDSERERILAHAEKILNDQIKKMKTAYKKAKITAEIMLA